jgi:DNA invertase Pin-like site-specific DNA recombinase
MEIKKLIEQKVKFILSVLTVDRSGRNLRNIINTVHFFTENKTPSHCISHGLTTLDSKGTESPIAKMMISILGVVGEMEKTKAMEKVCL